MLEIALPDRVRMIGKKLAKRIHANLHVIQNMRRNRAKITTGSGAVKILSAAPEPRLRPALTEHKATTDEPS